MSNESWQPPEGVRFCPYEDVLITDYLSNKIQGKPLPVEGVIMEAEVYGQFAGPWQLFQYDEIWQTRVDSCGKLISNESVRYVFTRLNKVGKGTGQKQINRGAGGGVWHGNSGEEVKDEFGEIVGTKKSFKYRCGDDVNLPEDTVYIMHEYSTLWCKEFVLCKIKMIKREKKTKRIILDDLQDRGKKSRPV